MLSAWAPCRHHLDVLVTYGPTAPMLKNPSACLLITPKLTFLNLLADCLGF
jgi:hypothetical protein